MSQARAVCKSAVVVRSGQAGHVHVQRDSQQAHREEVDQGEKEQVK